MSLLDLLKSWLNAAPPSPPTSTAGTHLQNRSMMKIPARLPKPTTDDLTTKRETTSKAPLRTARLIMVSAYNNKFYEMKELADGTFQASYGRVGASASSMTYPIKQSGYSTLLAWQPQRKLAIHSGQRPDLAPRKCRDHRQNARFLL